MEFIAISKSVRISPRKLRLITKSLGRNITAVDALGKLSLLEKRAATPIEKTLKSAIANAVNNGKLKADDLIVRDFNITDGTPLKRFRPSTRGRVHPYKKKSSHVKVIVEEKYGTKS